MTDFVPDSFPPAPFPPIVMGNLKVKLAETREEVLTVQALRYEIFVGEVGARPTPEMEAVGRDFDQFDPYCDHMLVIATNEGREEIVGTYRLLRRSRMAELGKFYSEDEFDITALKHMPGEIVELGRSCVREDYRSKAAMQLLWRGVGEYVTHFHITYMFGCASFIGADPKLHEEGLAYLHHYHHAPEDYAPKAVEGRYVEMNVMPKEKVNQKRAFYNLPVLIKGYMRLGGVVGNGAVIDHAYNTVDVSIVIKIAAVDDKYVSKYAPEKVR